MGIRSLGSGLRAQVPAIRRRPLVLPIWLRCGGRVACPLTALAAARTMSGPSCRMVFSVGAGWRALCSAGKACEVGGLTGVAIPIPLPAYRC